MGTETSYDSFRTNAAYSVLRRFCSSLFSPKAGLEVQRHQLFKLQIALVNITLTI